jgi:hypothetical protein
MESVDSRHNINWETEYSAANYTANLITALQTCKQRIQQTGKLYCKLAYYILQTWQIHCKPDNNPATCKQRIEQTGKLYCKPANYILYVYSKPINYFANLPNINCKPATTLQTWQPHCNPFEYVLDTYHLHYTNIQLYTYTANLPSTLQTFPQHRKPANYTANLPKKVFVDLI